jgi:hypothetical protein
MLMHTGMTKTPPDPLRPGEGVVDALDASVAHNFDAVAERAVSVCETHRGDLGIPLLAHALEVAAVPARAEGQHYAEHLVDIQRNAVLAEYTVHDKPGECMAHASAELALVEHIAFTSHRKVQRRLRLDAAIGHLVLGFESCLVCGLVPRVGAAGRRRAAAEAARRRQ